MFVFATVLSYVTGIQARMEDRKSDEGITAIEYAVMAALIVGVIGGATVVLQGKLSELFTGINV